MNIALERLAREADLSRPELEPIRLQFAHACVQRVSHLLEQPEVLACLQALTRHLAGELDRSAFEQARLESARLANQHAGSRSIDGCGHAAVSATYAVANALAGKALEAAGYAAYATVYAGGGTAAVADREAFEPEFRWQLGTLEQLLQETS